MPAQQSVITRASSNDKRQKFADRLPKIKPGHHFSDHFSHESVQKLHRRCVRHQLLLLPSAPRRNSFRCATRRRILLSPANRWICWCSPMAISIMSSTPQQSSSATAARPAIHPDTAPMVNDPEFFRRWGFELEIEPFDRRLLPRRKGNPPNCSERPCASTIFRGIVLAACVFTSSMKNVIIGGDVLFREGGWSLGSPRRRSRPASRGHSPKDCFP